MTDITMEGDDIDTPKGPLLMTPASLDSSPRPCPMASCQRPVWLMAAGVRAYIGGPPGAGVHRVVV